MTEIRERRMSKVSIRIICAAVSILLLLGGRFAFALSPDVALEDLKRTSFKLPSTSISFAQTSDRYFWIATVDGLFRFDGLRFERIELPRVAGISSMQPTSLFAPSSGGLWIGLMYGGAVFLNNGHTTAYSENDGLPAGSIKAFAQTNDGRIWAGGSGGLARLDGSRWHVLGPPENFSDSRVRSLLVDSAGSLWTESEKHVELLAKGEAQFRDLGIEPGGLTFQFSTLAESASGEVWLFKNDDWRVVGTNNGSEPKSNHPASLLLFDRDGGAWASPPEGNAVTKLRRLTHGDGIHHPVGSSLDSSYSKREELELKLDDDSGYPEGKIEDSEGNVWVLMNRSLCRFSERNVTTVQKLDTVRGGGSWQGVFPLAADQGAVWLLSRIGDSVLWGSAGSILQYGQLDRVSAGSRADNGTIWLGNEKGLWKSSGGRFERTELPPVTGGFDLQAVTQDKDGVPWISVVRKGVFKRVNGDWLPFGGLSSLPKLTAMSLATDGAGRVWFGYTEGRLAMVDSERVTVFADKEAPPIGNIKAIYGKRDEIWAGGEYGLAVLLGDHFRTLSADQYGTLANITGLVQVENGDLWINSRPGIVRISADEIKRAKNDAAYRLHGEIFDATDGVEGSSERLRPIPTAVEGTDEQLWFVRDAGLYKISPNRILRNSIPPHLVIKTLVGGQTSYSPEDGLRLPPNTSSIRIDYVGLNLTAPEKVRYRYMLDITNDGWQDVQDRSQAFYTNLPPGRHRFQVAASNGDGVWSEPATLTFFIPPTFVQTGWFVAVCVLAAGTLIWMLILLRVRQVSQRLRLRMNERERIARELHDTLLQGTQALILSVQAAADSAQRSDAAPAFALLNEALNRADELMAEGRDRIQDLRLPLKSEGDLDQAFASLCRELSATYPSKFEVTVEGHERALRTEVREEAYRIGREALLNCFRHAYAKSIEVQIAYTSDYFCLRIRDDGLGLDVTAVKTGTHPGHWGLVGMRERANQIGGRLEIWSRPQAGTEIELRVPARAAYPRGRAMSHWFSKLRRVA